jgi:hypothetical protein
MKLHELKKLIRRIVESELHVDEADVQELDEVDEEVSDSFGEPGPISDDEGTLVPESYMRKVRSRTRSRR